MGGPTSTLAYACTSSARGGKTQPLLERPELFKCVGLQEASKVGAPGVRSVPTVRVTVYYSASKP
jgi:hypothetical protein